MKPLKAFFRAGLLAVGIAGWQQSAFAQSVYEDYTFTTFAGASEWTSGWHDGIAANARFNQPGAMAMDSNGNLYIADRSNNTIRKMTPGGIVTTLAGLAGTSGTNDGVGAAARFFGPNGLVVDPAGNVYVSDSGNDTIRKITPGGQVTTIAGLPKVAGKVNGTGSAARFNNPWGLTISGTNLYVADAFNNAIRLVTPGGVVKTFAGSLGNSGSDNGTGTSAKFNFPVGIAVDATGNFYVTEAGNDTLRKITPGGAVSTVAGKAGQAGSDDGTNSTARFNQPLGVTVDANDNAYIADTGNETIRKVTSAGVVTTLAGTNGQAGHVDDTGSAARFNNPFGIVLDSNMNLLVADFDNDVIRKIDPNAVVTTIAGVDGTKGTNDGSSSQARFALPDGVAMDTNGNFYIADEGNDTIRKITPDGTVSTFAGTPGVSGTNNGPVLTASFNHPVGLAFDQNGNLFVLESQSDDVRMITPGGMVSTFAGSPGVSGTNNGVGTQAQFFLPIGIAVDSSNNVYVGDTQNHAIREITPDGTVSTLAGMIGSEGTNNGTGTNAGFSFPEGVAVDSDGNVFVVDNGDFTIREITPAGVVTTLAGLSGVSGSSDGTGTNAEFDFPFGLTIDANRNLYVVDSGNALIRKVTPSGTVTTLAGAPGDTGYVDATGDQCRFNDPEGIAVDSSGNLYVVDADNNSIRTGSPALTDRPTIDIPAGHTGVVRQLGVTNAQGTTWGWSFERYPSASSAQLSATNIENPTFTPDVEDIYMLRFEATDNSGHKAIRKFTIIADDTAPSVSITNPADGFNASNGLFTVQGTASDNLGVSNVWVQLNGGTWTNASGTENWSNNLALAPGTNVIRAYAEDFAGNVSPTNEVDLHYFVSDRLKVQAKGGGVIKPNLDGVFLQISNVYSMTAAAVPGSTFSNWTASIAGGPPLVITNSEKVSFVMVSNLALVANFLDHQNPTLKITSPKSSQFTSNAVFFVIGTAKDNDRVASVSYQLNGGEWTNAIGTNNWLAQVTLNPGTNTVLAYAQDASGNVSATNRAILNYVPSARLGISGNGAGTLTPNYVDALLAIGTNYTITAKPAKGYFFSNWVDNASNVVTTNPVLNFTMQSNSAFVVNFTRNGHFFAQGQYAGLFFDTNNLTATNAGFFSAAVTPSSAFTAKLLLGGSAIPASGQFSADGFFSNSVPTQNFGPLILQLQLDLTGQDVITGTINGNGWSDALTANRLVFSATNPPSQLFQRFTLAIPGGEDSSAQPGGNSFGNITVDNFGTVTFTGELADDSKAVQKTFLSKDGEWPFYISSANGQGVTLGWLTFSPGQGGTLNGHVYWDKLSGGTLYPAGFSFTNGMDASGSFYSFFIGRRSLKLTNGMIVLQQAGISPAITNYFRLSAKDTLTSTNGMNGAINIVTGVFRGTVKNPADNSSIPVKGVVLQSQTNVFGFFVNSNQSGSVFLGPPPQ